MAKKQGVLTEQEKRSLEIEKFIFHIIATGEKEPIYLKETKLDDSLKSFFLEIFSKASEGVKNVFIDREKSSFYKSCVQLVEDDEIKFLAASKELAFSFQKAHKGNTLDGAFIISVVKFGDGTRLIFLLKIDHKRVIEYKIENSTAFLHEITNTFVEDKEAIQKSAVVDISQRYEWDVLATDRSGKADQPLTMFFEDYLTVSLLETADQLTTTVMEEVLTWAVLKKEELSLEQDASYYKQKAINYLRSTPKYSAEGCIEAVFSEQVGNEKRFKVLNKELKDYFNEVGLSGQQFVPNPSVLTTAKTRHIRETAEGVRIEWLGEPDENNIFFKNKPDGSVQITIVTHTLTIKDK